MSSPLVQCSACKHGSPEHKWWWCFCCVGLFFVLLTVVSLWAAVCWGVGGWGDAYTPTQTAHSSQNRQKPWKQQPGADHIPVAFFWGNLIQTSLRMKVPQTCKQRSQVCVTATAECIPDGRKLIMNNLNFYNLHLLSIRLSQTPWISQ